MADTEKSTTKRKKRRRKSRPQRKQFLLDEYTLADLQYAQRALRATTASEALRTAIRQYAALVRYASKGCVIAVSDPDTPQAVKQLDIPTAVL